MISVLVPVYNVEKYLEQCLDSIVSQTYRDIEVICINDGSTDGSETILNDYADKDHRIKVISQPNSGYGKAMNSGLEAARGEYISIVESDDYIEPDMLEKLLEYAEPADVDFVKTDYYRFSHGTDVYSKLYNEPLYDVVFTPAEQRPDFLMCGGNIWSGLYKKTFLSANAIRFTETPGASYQDIGFNFKVFACAKSILIKNKAYYHYRIDNASSSVNSKAKVFCVCDEMQDIERFLSGRPDLSFVRDKWFPVYRFFCYRWNYNRITYEHRSAFLQRWHNDTVRDKDAGFLDRTAFYEDMKADLDGLLNNWENFYCEKFIETKYSGWIVEGFLNELGRYDTCYIYGAGNVGNLVLDLMGKYGIIIDSILVNDTVGNPEKLQGRPIINYRNDNIDKIASIVLVSVGRKYMFEVTEDLKKAGYKNVIPMTGGFIDRLK